MENFKKSDLKNGHVVEFRNGTRMMLVRNFSKDEVNEDVFIGSGSSFMRLGSYNEDLTNNERYDNDSDWDIIKVFSRKFNGFDLKDDLTLIWDRGEKDESGLEGFGCDDKLSGEEIEDIYERLKPLSDLMRSEYNCSPLANCLKDIESTVIDCLPKVEMELKKSNPWSTPFDSTPEDDQEHKKPILIKMKGFVGVYIAYYRNGYFWSNYIKKYEGQVEKWKYVQLDGLMDE